MLGMRVDNSPEFEARMEVFRKKEAERAARVKQQITKAIKKWEKAGCGWLPMEDCPFAGLDNSYGLDGTILVSDGTRRALVTVKERFGRPIFWKTTPERILRDGMMHLVGGETDPRDDLPKWWWKWELTDEFGNMTYAGGEETGKEEIDFVPNLWTFLPGTASAA